MTDSPLLYGDIVFNAKPDAVPYNYRVSYKVSLLCLIMRMCCSRDTCSLLKLHMISFAMYTRENMNRLLRFTNNESAVTPIVRFDPAVNKALTFAIAYGFVEQQRSGNFKLTDQGKNFADRIKMVDDLLEIEKIDISEIAKKLTEAKIKGIVDQWRNNNAAD
ncbi:MAG: hypothetical protein AB9917_19115 [Negativicutes bacterium]